MAFTLRTTLVAALLAVAAAAGPARAQDAMLVPVGATFPSSSMPAPADGSSRPLTEAEWGGIGCVVGGGISTVAALMAGPLEVIALMSGGAAAGPTPVATGTAIATLVFATFCNVGQATVPVVLMAYDRTGDIIRRNGIDTRFAEMWDSVTTQASASATAVSISAAETIASMLPLAGRRTPPDNHMELVQKNDLYSYDVGSRF
jgi:hypothetical protein